ncbi:3'-5' RNA helicase YTHDC2 [Caerostris extrusa]|uniref:3'-5' RNA helicase YTHDC2 n=1 Tax=Caerostris extrusa TaxID=172846 RepID=A0AAV4RS78_CAEEX|nr:3'-5' RNA helicase YTHDC2 [Caerostris extrusa]
MLSDDMPILSNAPSSSNYNPAFGSCSPQKNPKLLKSQWLKIYGHLLLRPKGNYYQLLRKEKEVILIFSIQGSGHFQGFARFTPQLSDHRPPEFSAANLGTCYQVEWLKKANIPFQSTRHLQNAWNENRKVQISRDGQELEPSVGESLCRLIVKDSLFLLQIL